jgi:hypothetical protein
MEWALAQATTSAAANLTATALALGRFPQSLAALAFTGLAQERRDVVGKAGRTAAILALGALRPAIAAGLLPIVLRAAALAA